MSSSENKKNQKDRYYKIYKMQEKLSLQRFAFSNNNSFPIILLVLQLLMNNGQVWQQDDLEQSQIINKRFKQLLRSTNFDSQQPSESHFDQNEQNLISQRFYQLCHHGNRMDYQEFRRGLGLLGREDSFICRIFNLIDQDNDGYITQENYLHYLRVILRGNDLQKSRFGWLILTEGRGDIEFKDFMELFQEISVVWNALTGQIVTPKRKYIQELFNTFDVDQDQAITYNDYRLFFNEHLQLFGWFQYFNNLEVSEETSRTELQKVRDKLRSKLKLRPQGKVTDNAEELKLLIHDTERQIQRKLGQLTTGLIEGSQYIKTRHMEIKQAQEAQLSTEHKSIYQTSTNKSGKTGNTADDDSLSLRSLYKYNYAESMRSTPINKIQNRKKKIRNQSRSHLNMEVANQLKGFLETTYKMMELCQNYRNYTQRQKKFSPTKLKQMQAKLKLFDIDQNKKAKKQQTPKQKMTVYFGHENWNLVLNIMVGLRQSIKALYELNSSIQTKDSHFNQQHQFFLGNKAYLSGKGPQALKSMQNFLFIQMAPVIFQRLRNMYGISNTEYQRSVGPEYLLNQLLTGDLTALNEKCSTGKSGSFFYLTTDNKIFLKTIPKSQFIFFTKILKNYYQHMLSNKNSLIVRIYGLYKLKIYVNKQKINTIYFISMENIFQHLKKEEGAIVEEIYDLKGSLYGRTGSDGQELKDQDWMQRGKKISLPQQISVLFREQIKADSRFFKKNNINDYSLMVAFVKHPPHQTPSKNGNIFKSLRGGVPSKTPGKMIVLSIIDILTVFETRKNLEYIFKSTFLSKDVSCIPPSDYCQRFRDFIYNSIQ